MSHSFFVFIALSLPYFVVLAMPGPRSLTILSVLVGLGLLAALPDLNARQGDHSAEAGQVLFIFLIPVSIGIVFRSIMLRNNLTLRQPRGLLIAILGALIFPTFVVGSFHLYLNFATERVMPSSWPNAPIHR